MFRVTRLQKITGHPWVRAIAEVDWQGLKLRGIKLEQHQGRWCIKPPGRKIQGLWQELYAFQNTQMEEALLNTLRLHHG